MGSKPIFRNKGLSIEDLSLRKIKGRKKYDILNSSKLYLIIPKREIL